MVYDWKHLDTVKQWKNLIFLNHQHLLNLSQHLLIFGHHFVIIPETLFTAIFSKENIRKNGQKNEKCQNFEKNFSVNSKDVMTWVCLDENMSPRRVLNTLSCSQIHYSWKPPPLSTPREKMTFFDPFFTFNKNFRMFGQQVLTKLLSWKESPNFPLQDPNFGFFISLLVMKIFCFENKSHEG